jgi:hypothetical protein
MSCGYLVELAFLICHLRDVPDALISFYRI